VTNFSYSNVIPELAVGLLAKCFKLLAHPKWGFLLSKIGLSQSILGLSNQLLTIAFCIMASFFLLLAMAEAC
jgi:hypothetical protein